MSEQDRSRWNQKYASQAGQPAREPDEWLVAACRRFESASQPSPTGRRAIDLACGLGHNAIWLAAQGWSVDAVDISTIGLNVAEESAKLAGVSVNWIEADLDSWVPPADQYDFAIIFRFLDRQSIPRIVHSAIRPSGWLIYETFSSAQCRRADNHLRNPAFTLAPGELIELFPEFDVVENHEVALADRTVERFIGRRKT